MSRRLLAPGAVLVLAALCACVPISSRPLSAPEAAHLDTRLAGGWRVAANESGWTHVYFSRRTAGAGAMRIIVLEPRKDGTLAMDAYDGFATHLRGADFLNIAYSEGNGGRSGYVLVRYRLREDGRLEVALPDEGRLKAAVAAGRIRGLIEARGSGTELTLTAGPAALAEFLTSPEGEAAFQSPQLLERLR